MRSGRRNVGSEPRYGRDPLLLRYRFGPLANDYLGLTVGQLYYIALGTVRRVDALGGHHRRRDIVVREALGRVSSLRLGVVDRSKLSAVARQREAIAAMTVQVEFFVDASDRVVSVA
jgi:hypothetical protein